MPISPMPSTVGRSRNFGIRCSTSRDSSRLSDSFGFIAEPRVVLDAVLRGAPRLELRQLPEVVLEAVAALRSQPAQNAGSVTATHPVSAICA